MRVLILHEDRAEALRVARSAYDCWGPTLTRVEILPDLAPLGARLADPATWPDVLLVSLRLIEDQPAQARLVLHHPAHGFYRLLTLGANSDELARAAWQRLGDARIPEPVTRRRLAEALKGDC